jgi:hypothetical protein
MEAAIYPLFQNSIKKSLITRFLKKWKYLTGCIVYYIMIAMGSLRRNEDRKVQINAELHCLGKGFKSLTIDQQKWVLKMAWRLLKIQRTCKTMTADRTRICLKDKNG